mmetsp:Transcript_988/g.1873  ORF Transcript_988/g.1873 Transcript_988/m.1873 type:complete len:92 (-) Transcript_988:26-301(-)
MKIHDRRIRVQWSEVDLVKHSVHVQFDKSKAAVMTRAALYTAFQKHGKIIAIDTSQLNRGTAFVHFKPNDAGAIAAATAIKTIRKVAGVSV